MDDERSASDESASISPTTGNVGSSKVRSGKVRSGKVRSGKVRSGDTGLSWGLAIFLVFAIMFVVFVVQNSDNVPVRFLNWEGTFPLPLILVITAILAVVADEIFGLTRRRRRRHRLAEREELERFRRS